MIPAVSRCRKSLYHGSLRMSNCPVRHTVSTAPDSGVRMTGLDSKRASTAGRHKNAGLRAAGLKVMASPNRRASNATAARRTLDQRHDLALLRVTTQLRFLEDRLAVDAHLESTTPRRLHINRPARKPLSELGRQTGGPRLVVSNRAILDRNRHAPLTSHHCRHGQTPRTVSFVRSATPAHAMLCTARQHFVHAPVRLDRYLPRVDFQEVACATHTPCGSCWPPSPFSAPSSPSRCRPSLTRAIAPPSALPPPHSAPPSPLPAMRH